jgi:hypothetical protein
MKNRHLVLIALLSPMALTACVAEPTVAETDAKIRAVTASVIADAPTEQIAISDFKRGAAKATWQAKVKGKTYACDSDEQLRLPACNAI